METGDSSQAGTPKQLAGRFSNCHRASRRRDRCQSDLHRAQRVRLLHRVQMPQSEYEALHSGPTDVLCHRHLPKRRRVSLTAGKPLSILGGRIRSGYDYTNLCFR